MLFKITFICDEVDDFVREITIDADATFLDLNKAILDACGYADDQITSFYTCNDEWEQLEQITREDMGTTSADQDVFIMERTPLREFILDEGQKLLYVFDPFNDRVFYLKVMELITGRNLEQPQCTRSRGEAPQQIKDISEDPLIQGSMGDDLLGEDSEFYGSGEFDQEDIDFEGFEIEEH